MLNAICEYRDKAVTRPARVSVRLSYVMTQKKNQAAGGFRPMYYRLSCAKHFFWQSDAFILKLLAYQKSWCSGLDLPHLCRLARCSGLTCWTIVKRFNLPFLSGLTTAVRRFSVETFQRSDPRILLWVSWWCELPCKVWTAYFCTVRNTHHDLIR